MVKRRRYCHWCSFGLLVLALLFLSGGVSQPRLAAQGARAELQLAPSGRGWAFHCVAHILTLFPPTPPVSGVRFIPYGSQLGDEPGDAPLASGFSDASGQVTLQTTQEHPFHFVVYEVPQGYVTAGLACGVCAISFPQHWARWGPSPLAGTVELDLALREEPTPTLTSTLAPSPTSTTTRTATPSRTPSAHAAATRTATRPTTPVGEPAVRIAKVRKAQVPAAPAAVGEAITFALAVTNTGATPLLNLVVEDPYDQQCLTYVDSEAPPLPGSDLRWELPSLATGHSRSWDVVFQLDAGCDTLGNRASVQADGPQGQHVVDHACVELDIAPPEAGLQVRKRVAEGQAPPYPGSTIHFTVEVQNTGGSAMPVVQVADGYDADCLAFQSAEPPPSTVGAASGQISWADIGPLAPGQSRHIQVYLQAKPACGLFGNCARASWMVEDVPELEAMDCIEVPRGAARPIYLPLVMRQRHSPAPPPTATAAASPIGTSTPTVTGPPGATLLFADDFEDGDLEGWTPTGGQWEAWGGEMIGDLLTGNVWNMRSEVGVNVIYEGKVCPFSGWAGPGLTIRASADGTFSYDVSLDLVASVFKLSKRSPDQVLDSYTIAPEAYGTWHEIKVIAVGSHIEGYLDGVKRLEATDPTYSNGYLGVMLDRSIAKFDDLRAWSLP